MNLQFENPEVVSLEAFASDEFSHDGAFELLIFGLRTQRKQGSIERGEANRKTALLGRKSDHSEWCFLFPVSPSIRLISFRPFPRGLLLCSRDRLVFSLDCLASAHHMLRLGLPSGHQLRNFVGVGDEAFFCSFHVLGKAPRAKQTLRASIFYRLATGRALSGWPSRATIKS